MLFISSKQIKNQVLTVFLAGISDRSSAVFSMESSEISPDEKPNNIELSDHLTIKGKLHIWSGLTSLLVGR